MPFVIIGVIFFVLLVAALGYNLMFTLIHNAVKKAVTAALDEHHAKTKTDTQP
jgi:uncharacterized protein YpmB